MEPWIWNVNHQYIEQNKGIEFDMVSATEAEMDEMWSFVHDKKQQYWLWWAIDHKTGTPFAFCFGSRKHCNLDKLLKLLKGVVKLIHPTLRGI